MFLARNLLFLLYWVQLNRIFMFIRRTDLYQSMLFNCSFDLRYLLNLAQNLGILLLCLLSQRLLLKLPGRKVCTTALVEHFDLWLRILVGLLVSVLMNSFAEWPAHVYQVVHWKMAVSIVAFGWATEWRFQGVGVCDVEFLKDNDTSCWFLGLVYAEHAAVEAEVIAVFVEQPWEHFLFCREALQLEICYAVAYCCIWYWDSTFVLGSLNCGYWVRA